MIDVDVKDSTLELFSVEVNEGLRGIRNNLW